METMRMVFPTLEYKDKAVDYIQEFYEFQSDINGAGGLPRYLEEATYEEWLVKLQKQMDIANIDEEHVPGLTYFYVRESDERIVGMVNIRLALNELLRYEDGHIGYSIRPTERRKGYGSRMLEAALKVTDKLSIPKVVVTCDKVNVASAGVAKNCRGILEEEFFSEIYEETVQRYLINREEHIKKWF